MIVKILDGKVVFVVIWVEFIECVVVFMVKGIMLGIVMVFVGVDLVL